VEALRETIRNVEERSEGPELDKALGARRLDAAGQRSGSARRTTRRCFETQSRTLGPESAHAHWIAQGAAPRMAEYLHFHKSLGESILARRGRDLPIAIVRPSIVESSERSPFTGWNEGINTSGPLSYLLGTNFRQLPSNERKCLDVIPVDMVCRGMTLIASAVVARRHARMYQLATSAINPVNMGRSIELTGLAHRKHYRTTNGIDSWLKVKFESIPVSKQRYERLSIPMQKAVISRINRVAVSLRMKKPPLARAERDLISARKS